MSDETKSNADWSAEHTNPVADILAFATRLEAMGLPMSDEPKAVTYLCIGGPLDGQRITLEPGATDWRIIEAFDPLRSTRLREGRYVVAEHIAEGPALRWEGWDRA